MVNKPKVSHILIAGFLLICTLWAASPKAYIHNLFDHHHNSSTSIPGETSVQSDAEPDCDFDRYNTPVYFTIFKFINKFIPVKHKEEAYLSKPVRPYDSNAVGREPSRAPPLA